MDNEEQNTKAEFRFDAENVGELFKLAGALDAWRSDASMGLLMPRALNAFLDEVYEEEIAPAMADTILPTNATERDQMEFRYQLVQKYGKAKIISNRSTDPAVADADSIEMIARAFPFGIAYDVSIFDLMAQARTGVAIDSARALAAREGSVSALDEFAAVGDAAYNRSGLLNDANVPLVTPIVTNWTPATNTQSILDSLLATANAPGIATQQRQPATAMVVPPTTYALISTKRMDSNTSDTILSMFQKMAPFITDVYQWCFAETASAAANKRIVAYRKVKSVVTQEVPKPFTVLPEQPRRYHVEFNCYSHSAGTLVKFPKAIAYSDIGT